MIAYYVSTAARRVTFGCPGARLVVAEGWG